jgi:hypothetical protein
MHLGWRLAKKMMAWPWALQFDDQRGPDEDYVQAPVRELNHCVE